MDIEKKQGSLSASQIIKKELEKLCDPEPDMTERERADHLRKILAKIENGKKLTAKEMDYLRVHDRMAYQKALRMKQKREMLEAQMKHCRSKQEVDETVNDAISHISEKDPDKQALIATYREAYKEFRKTTGYKSLPDTKKEAERRRGKGRRLLWEGNSLCEMDPWPGTAGETYGVDGLCRVGDGATPLDEIYDSMPMLDVIG